MKIKTITKHLDKKITDWLQSITDEQLRARVKKDLIVTGGCIASMLLKEEVNDYDIYFKTKQTCFDISKYYVGKILPIYKNNISDSVIEVVDSKSIPTKDYEETTQDYSKWSFFKKGLERSEEERIKIYIPHIGYWRRSDDVPNENQEEVTKSVELQTRCNAKYFYNLMAWTSENVYRKKLILHDDNKPLIRAICFFFSRDERFETELKLDLNKGLLIRGVSGLGKTFLFRCIENNYVRPISIVSMIDISEEVKEEGYYNLIRNHTIYLDDVGTEEPTVNHYGTKINWFKNFIEMYYLKNQLFNRLVISTNNNFDEIEAKYGFRVRSRMSEMFNIIDVTGKDMRK